MQTNNLRPISVVMATYNGAKYLEEQIESILSQSLLPAEIIVCDDCSNDGTLNILENYQHRGLLKYYVNEKRLGVVDNFIKAIGFAQQDNYIALSDQDDIWMPNKLEIQALALSGLEQSQVNQGSPCIIYSDLILVDSEKNTLNISFWNELNHDVHEHCLHTLLFGNFVTGCTVMFNSATKKYLSQVPNHILHDVWLAFIGNTFGKIISVKTPLVYYRQHNENANYQVGNRKKTKWQERFKRLKKIFTNKAYLEAEYEIAGQFLTQYKSEINASQQKIINRFLETKNGSYLRKEIALKSFFRGRWK